jgi:HAE1 family hydrophobic/amphiphilic exporter-1
VGVRTLGRVEHVEEFNNIIIKNVGGAPIRLRDVGVAEDGMTEKRTFAYYNGRAAVLLDIRRQIGTNTVKVVDGIQAKLSSIAQQLPPGVKIDVVKEQATYIRASVSALENIFCSGVCWRR